LDLDILSHCRDIGFILDNYKGKQSYLQLFGWTSRWGGKISSSQWCFDFGCSAGLWNWL